MYISKLIRWREDKKEHANFAAKEGSSLKVISPSGAPKVSILEGALLLLGSNRILRDTLLPKFIIYQRERTVAVRCVGVYKSKRNCKSARRYPCTVKRRTWVVTGLKKDGTAAMHRTLMLYVNEIGFYALNEKIVLKTR